MYYCSNRVYSVKKMSGMKWRIFHLVIKANMFMNTLLYIYGILHLLLFLHMKGEKCVSW